MFLSHKELSCTQAETDLQSVSISEIYLEPSCKQAAGLPSSSEKKLSHQTSNSPMKLKMDYLPTLGRMKAEIGKIHDLLDKGLGEKWNVVDYGNREKLHSSYHRGNLVNRKDYRKFLEHLYKPDYMKHVATYLYFRTNDVHETKAICEQLGHFYCRKKSGNEHQHGCPFLVTDEEFCDRFIVKASLEQPGLKGIQESAIINELHSDNSSAVSDQTVLVPRGQAPAARDEVLVERNVKEDDLQQDVGSPKTSQPTTKQTGERSTTFNSSKDVLSDVGEEIEDSDVECSISVEYPASPAKTSQAQPSSKRRFTLEELLLVRKGVDNSTIFEFKAPFEVQVDFDDWVQVWNMQSQKSKGKSGYQEVIQKSLAKLGIPCSYNSNGYKTLGQNSDLGIVRFRGYCRTGGKTIGLRSAVTSKPNDDENKKCQLQYCLYLQEIKYNEPVRFVVHATGEFQAVQQYNTSRQIRGFRREHMRDKAKHEKAKKMYLNAFTDMTDFQYLHGNLGAQSLGVFQKIRSEAIVDHNEPVPNTLKEIYRRIEELKEELQGIRRFQSLDNPEWNGFIQRTLPHAHAVQLYTPKQIKYATLCDSFYLDSTGQMVKRLEDKQVLFHSLVAKPNNLTDLPTVPVMEFLARTGTRNVIEFMLREYSTEIKKVKPQWRPSLVVTDFSLAYIHAVTLSFNEEPLHHYLNGKYDNMLSTDSIGTSRTTLFVCTGHFLHFVSDYMKKNTINKPAVQSAMHAFGHFVAANSHNHYEKLVDSVITLFGMKRIDEDVQQEIVNEFKNVMIHFDFEEHLQDFRHTVKSDIEMNEIVPDNDSKLQRDKVKFYKYFVKRRAELISKSTREDSWIKNEFYDPVILSLFERWNTYIPLWSKIAFIGQQIPTDTITTGYVENYFGQLKSSIHTVRNLREDIFIKQHSDVADNFVSDALARGFFLRSSTKKPKGTLKTKKKGDAIPTPYRKKGNPAFATSNWGPKRRRKKPTYIKKADEFRKEAAGRTPSTNTHSDSSMEGEGNQPGSQKCSQETTEDKDILGIKISVLNEYIPKLLETEDGTEISDPFQTSEKIWVKETKNIDYLFFSHDKVHYGDESDILTLADDRFVSSVVAGRMSQLILQNELRKGGDRLRNVHMLPPTAVFGVGDLFAADDSTFPEITEVEAKTSVFYQVTFLDNHAFLTRINMATATISYYDTLNRSKSPFQNEVIMQRDAYYVTLVEALQKNYSYTRAFSVLEGSCPEQTGNECVQMSLLNLIALLRDQDPVEMVSPLYARVYRSEIMKTLLEETATGKHVLKHFQDDTKALVNEFKTRDSIRKEVDKIYKCRNSLNELVIKAKELDQSEKTPSNKEWLNILNKTASLYNRIQSMDLSFEQTSIFLNSKIQQVKEPAAESTKEFSFSCLDNGHTSNITNQTQDDGDKIGSQATSGEGIPTSQSTFKAEDNEDVFSLFLDPATLAGGVTYVMKQLENQDLSDLTPEEAKFQKLLKHAPHIRGVDDPSDDEKDSRPTLFPLLEKKRKLYAVHEKNIKELSMEQILKFTGELKPDIINIVEGRVENDRMKLYRQGDSSTKLLNRAVCDPFTMSQAEAVAEHVNLKFFDREYPEKFVYLVPKVIVPEILIRIFARVNKVDPILAELEMRFGPYYEGPLALSADESST